MTTTTTTSTLTTGDLTNEATSYLNGLWVYNVANGVGFDLDDAREAIPGACWTAVQAWDGSSEYIIRFAHPVDGALSVFYEAANVAELAACIARWGDNVAQVLPEL